MIMQPDEMAKTFRNSYHLVATLAGKDMIACTQLGIGYLPPATSVDFSELMSWDHRNFLLQRTTKGSALAAIPYPTELTNWDNRGTFEQFGRFNLDEQRTGCPALIDAGNVPSLRRILTLLQMPLPQFLHNLKRLGASDQYCLTALLCFLFILFYPISSNYNCRHDSYIK